MQSLGHPKPEAEVIGDAGDSLFLRILPFDLLKAIMEPLSALHPEDLKVPKTKQTLNPKP